jgi:hypothetical protein
MKYGGRYPVFPSDRISTYPVAERTNRVTLDDLVRPEVALHTTYDLHEQESAIGQLAGLIAAAVRSHHPVIGFFGAHVVKNGLGPLVADLIRRRILTLVATNGAGAIHDFELALIGQTSEHVPRALPEGKFGMAREFSYMNAALAEGEEQKLGFGEVLGKFMCENAFRSIVERRIGTDCPVHFAHTDVSILATAYECNVPLTVHVGVGTDVIDQHANFDGAAKGGCSGRDFLIYAQEITRVSGGGVVLNVSSAVTGPEVLLKAVSMAGNVGKPPTGIVTADFDLRPYHADSMTDENSADYYVRHQKSVATRIPRAFGGTGFYVQGDHRITFPRLYQRIVECLTIGNGI